MSNITPSAGKKLYVASRASLPQRSAMWRYLRESGLAITSTWIDESGEGQTSNFGELWLRIASEIQAADALVLYAYTADFPLKGALVEVGIALGMGKPVYVCLPGVTLEARTDRPVGSWIRHPNVKIVEHVESAWDWEALDAAPSRTSGGAKIYACNRLECGIIGAHSKQCKEAHARAKTSAVIESNIGQKGNPAC